MTKPLRPNSPEWIKAVKERNLRQGQMTEMVVRASGREDICSICGDEPSVEYRRTNTDAAVANIRLCADCLGMQSAQGVQLVPVN